MFAVSVFGSSRGRGSEYRYCRQAQYLATTDRPGERNKVEVIITRATRAFSQPVMIFSALTCPIVTRALQPVLLLSDRPCRPRSRKPIPVRNQPFAEATKHLDMLTTACPNEFKITTFPLEATIDIDRRKSAGAGVTHDINTTTGRCTAQLCDPTHDRGRRKETCHGRIRPPARRRLMVKDCMFVPLMVVDGVPFSCSPSLCWRWFAAF